LTTCTNSQTASLLPDHRKLRPHGYWVRRGTRKPMRIIWPASDLLKTGRLRTLSHRPCQTAHKGVNGNISPLPSVGRSLRQSLAEGAVHLGQNHSVWGRSQDRVYTGPSQHPKVPSTDWTLRRHTVLLATEWENRESRTDLQAKGGWRPPPN
jgi:hypothetical protein